MQCIYNKQYLKDLNIQRSYLNRFAWDKASYDLRQDLMKAVRSIDVEILRCKTSLEQYSKKRIENKEQLKLF